MISSLSIALYRLMMRSYPARFRSRYGDAVDQAFRDNVRDAVQRRGTLGLALLWFHIIPDFLFSSGELLLARAGDFLKWRFRMQWAVACSFGFLLSRLTIHAIGPHVFGTLRPLGLPWIDLSAMLQIVILLGSVGFAQSRTLAGRFFRKTQWALYGLAGAVLTTLIFQPIWPAELLAGPPPLMRFAASLRAIHPALTVVARGFIQWPHMIVFGAGVGLLQSAAIRKGAVATWRWTIACAAGYYLAQVAGGSAEFLTDSRALQIVLHSSVAGLVLGFITSSPVEQILLTAQKDGRNRS